MNIIKFTVLGRAIAAVRMTQKDKWKLSAVKYLSYKESVLYCNLVCSPNRLYGVVTLFYLFSNTNPFLLNVSYLFSKLGTMICIC